MDTILPYLCFQEVPLVIPNHLEQTFWKHLVFLPLLSIGHLVPVIPKPSKPSSAAFKWHPQLQCLSISDHARWSARNTLTIIAQEVPTRTLPLGTQGSPVPCLVIPRHFLPRIFSIDLLYRSGWYPSHLESSELMTLVCRCAHLLMLCLPKEHPFPAPSPTTSNLFLTLSQNSPFPVGTWQLKPWEALLLLLPHPRNVISLYSPCRCFPTKTII